MITRTGFICAVIYLCLLAGACTLQAADKSICSDGSFVTVNDDGSLKECTLKDKYFINGVACKGFAAIRFYDGDKLESCILSDNVTIGDTNCQADGQIIFYRDGNLRQCLKYED
jgi:hypothetical protein